MFADAVNVTVLPVQVDGVEVKIEMSGVTTGETVIVIPELVIEEGIAQTVLLVNVHVTTSPFKRVEEVNVVLFVPTLIPLTIH